MKRFALIGHPVQGSHSPRLFRAAYGGRYPYDLIDESSFQAAWDRFLRDYDGINITAPFKLDAFSAVDIPSAEAISTGAVNLAVKTPGGIAGYNTDVDGVIGAVRECGRDFEEALVIGTGGAARAAVAAAEKLGLRVTVAGRSEAKASALGCPGICLEGLRERPLPEGKPLLLIYTLPGSAPVPDGLPLRGSVVLEAEYRTPRLRDAQCLQYIGGERWLLHQAIAGYSLFTGEAPNIEKML